MIDLLKDKKASDDMAALLNSTLPWEEKYRGHDLNTIILRKPLENMFKSAIEMGSFGNYILHSGATGTGKTSLAKAIPEILNAQSMFLYGKRDTEIIEAIEEYAKYSCADAQPKFVIIDEADKPTNPDKFYRTLQSAIEDSTSTLRFILTCNELWRIPRAIQSRCIPIDFGVRDENAEEEKDYKKRVFKRLMEIARSECGAKGGEVDKNTVFQIFNENFPDIRLMIATMHRSFLENHGSIIGAPPAMPTSVIETIFNYTVTFNPRELRRYLSLNVPFCPGVYRPFGDFAIDRLPDETLIPFGVALAEAVSIASRQVDQEIALWGFLLKVMQILKKYAPNWKYEVK